MPALPLFIAIPTLLTAVSLEAQFQDRLYPFIELTDEMRARIDLKDGSVEDWLDVLGEPTLTPLDFVPSPLESYNPSSYDFRIWLAWHDATNHLFVGAEIVDDFHVSEYERGDIWADGDASIWFYVDADKSGGELFEAHGGGEIPDDMQQAQWYTAFARTYSNDSNVTLVNVSLRADWVHQVPYADGGGGIVDSQPILSVVEFNVTPFDHLIWRDPEQSVVSDLFAGKTIGFGLVLADVDTKDLTHSDSWYGLFGPDASYDNGEIFSTSDLWAHGILVGADGRTGDTAVKTVSWGGVKANLSE